MGLEDEFRSHVGSDRKPRIRLFTDPNYFGAEVDDSLANELATVDIELDSLVAFEPDEQMEAEDSAARLNEMIQILRSGSELAPILVRVYNNGYQVVDGHHRFRAYRKAERKTIPAKIVPDDEIEIVESPASHP